MTAILARIGLSQGAAVFFLVVLVGGFAFTSTIYIKLQNARNEITQLAANNAALHGAVSTQKMTINSLSTAIEDRDAELAKFQARLAAQKRIGDELRKELRGIENAVSAIDFSDADQVADTISGDLNGIWLLFSDEDEAAGGAQHIRGATAAPTKAPTPSPNARKAFQCPAPCKREDD